MKSGKHQVTHLLSTKVRWAGEYSDYFNRLPKPKKGPNYQPKRKRKK